MQDTFSHIKQSYTQNTGGNFMCDVMVLSDYTVLVVGDDSIVLYPDMDTWLHSPSDQTGTIHRPHTPDRPKFGVWRVQVGKRRGAYATKYTLTSRIAAQVYYNGVNVGNGWKKRLLDPTGKTVARTISY